MAKESGSVNAQPLPSLSLEKLGLGKEGVKTSMDQPVRTYVTST